MTIIAIDFGTSNTVVCVQDPITLVPRTLRFNALSRRFEAAPEAGPGAEAVYVVPSLVFVQNSQTLLLGETVRSQRLGYAHPDRSFQAFKRELVADYRPPPRQIDGETFTAERISEAFLKEIWQQILQQQWQPSRVIFTVPVGAFERYLDWFRDFGQHLDVPLVQLVDESTAAALGYAIKRPSSLVLVIDFGGGTLDLSLVRTVAGSKDQSILRAEVIAKSDAYVGGVDIDTWIVQHYLRQIGSSRELVQEIGWQNLLEVAERVKIRLSSAPEAKESWFDDETFYSHELHLTQADFADILESQQLLEQLRQAIDEVLTIAYNKGIGKAEIEQVLLVGGSCQIPAVQQLVISYFGKQRVKLDKPFDAVAAGALVLGQILDVQDDLRHSYAIRLWEPYTRSHSYFPLFQKGMRYPCQRPEPLVLQVAIQGQREIRLDIGEVADLAQAEVAFDAQGRMTSSQLLQHSEFRSLESHHEQVCVAHLDPPGEKGIDRIEVQFEVNAQRILLATVRDLVTQKVLVEREAIAKLK